MDAKEQIRVLFLGDGSLSLKLTLSQRVLEKLLSLLLLSQKLFRVQFKRLTIQWSYLLIFTCFPSIPPLCLLILAVSIKLSHIEASKDDEQMTDGEIEKAHVIMLVYNVYNVDCIKRLRTFWLPRIQKINDKVIYIS